MGEDFEFIKVKGTLRDNETDISLSQLNLEMERLYIIYLKFLKILVQLPNNTTARELFDLFFAVEVQPRFNLLVEYIGRKRNIVKIQEVDPFKALMAFHEFPFLLDKDLEKIYGVRLEKSDKPPQ